MNIYSTQLTSLLNVVAIKSPNKFFWFNEIIDCSIDDLPHSTDNGSEWLMLSAQLKRLLYKNFYCVGKPVRFLRQNNRLELPLSESLAETLSSVNSGIGYRQHGWSVVAINNECVSVNNDGVTLRVQRDKCLSCEGDELKSGAKVALQFPKELKGISPGHYVAVGNRILEKNESTEIIRIYWNLAPNNESRFTQWVTSEFNKLDIAFWLKILTSADHFHRCDSGVLYIDKCDFVTVANILESNQHIHSMLTAGVPVFTKPLLKGIGVAEDPGNGESFGIHRCALLADGIIVAHQLGAESLNDKINVIDQHFAKEGVDFNRPFLNNGSSDCYHLAEGFSCQDEGSNQKTSICPKKHDDTFWLDTACSIGKYLLSTAIWSHDRCTWLGYQMVPCGTIGIKGKVGLSTLGQDLYGGIAGIALFIAELAYVSKDNEFRNLALGAIRQVLSQIDDPRLTPLGLHTGKVGLALVIARTAHLLNEPSMLDEAIRLVQCQDAESINANGFDLLHGLAGTLLGLTIVHKLTEHAPCLDIARTMADRIIVASQTNKQGCSWPDTSDENNLNLLGYSHGAAGIAHSLIELYGVTGDDKYKETALLAMDYENHWFDQSEGNWPDLRNVNSQTELPMGKSFMCTWCHGAAGIALSRLRAWQIVGDEVHREEAMTALRKTSETLENGYNFGISDFSLCHGVAGNLDILLEGKRIFDKGLLQDENILLRMAHLGVKDFSETGQWPTGLVTGSTPGLMMGIAGIGHFYLRLYDSKVPSILALSPSDF